MKNSNTLAFQKKISCTGWRRVYSLLLTIYNPVARNEKIKHRQHAVVHVPVDQNYKYISTSIN
jgi:hypothetical protein